MTSPEIHAPHTPPESPEVAAIRQKTTDELAESLLDLAGEPLDTSLNTVVGYIPSGQPLNLENIVYLRDSLDKLRNLQFEQQFKSAIGKLALKSTLAKLIKETAIPDGAQVLLEASRHFYRQCQGPQISNDQSAFWDLTVWQRAIVHQTEDGQKHEVPGSHTNTYELWEYYLDENGSVARQHDFDESEIHERLVFMANAIVK